MNEWLDSDHAQLGDLEQPSRFLFRWQGIEVVGEARNAIEAVKMAKTYRPDVITIFLREIVVKLD